MRLIGLHGRKGAGKDETYAIAKRLLPGARVVRVAFADKLKISGMRALGFDGPDEELIRVANKIKAEGWIATTYDDPEGTVRGKRINGREFWQRYGTEAHRDVFGDSFWIDVTLPRPCRADSRTAELEANRYWLAERFPDADYVFITDVRFENEAERILGLGGEVWLIDRPQADDGDTHASERPLPSTLVTRRIDNSGSLDDLGERVREAL